MGGGEGVSPASVKLFLSLSAKKFRIGTLLCSRFLRVLKKLLPKSGLTRFSVENLLSQCQKIS